MPWKLCPYCGGLSYSAATQYSHWPCPYCLKDIKMVPDTDPQVLAERRTTGDKPV